MSEGPPKTILVFYLFLVPIYGENMHLCHKYGRIFFFLNVSKYTIFDVFWLKNSISGAKIVLNVKISDNFTFLSK